MDKRPPSTSRAFWTTTAVVGTINVAFLLYYLSLPLVPTGKGGVRIGRNVPEWAMSMYVMNAPVYFVAIPLKQATDIEFPATESQVVLSMVVCHTISTFFWGAVAVLIETPSVIADRSRRPHRAAASPSAIPPG